MRTDQTTDRRHHLVDGGQGAAQIEDVRAGYGPQQRRFEGGSNVVDKNHIPVAGERNDVSLPLCRLPAGNRRPGRGAKLAARAHGQRAKPDARNAVVRCVGATNALAGQLVDAVQGHRKWYDAIVRTEHAGAAGIHHIAHLAMTRGLEDVDRADQIDVGARDRIGSARRGQQRRQMGDGVAAFAGRHHLGRFRHIARAPFDGRRLRADDIVHQPAIIPAIKTRTASPPASNRLASHAPRKPALPCTAPSCSLLANGHAVLGKPAQRARRAQPESDSTFCGLAIVARGNPPTTLVGALLDC